MSDLHQSEILSAEEMAKRHVERALVCLQLVESHAFAPEYLVSVALNEIFLAAARIPNIPAVAPDAAEKASALLQECCPVLDASVHSEIRSERLYFFLGTATGLLSSSVDPFRAERLAYAGLIAAELSAVHHKRSLEESGHQLLRDARMRHAWAQTPNPDSLIQ